MKKTFSTAALLLIFLPFLFSLSFDDPGDIRDLASRLTEAMTDEQALAQTFMLGWVGAEPSPLIMDWIRNRNIGGVKIFGWNTDDTLRLAQTVGVLQENALATRFGIPLLIATDQEGGLVRHVRGDTSDTPGNMAIGASGRPIDAYWAGYYIGRELALLGINMNFAPTVDLFTNHDSVLIGPRSFGSDPVHAGVLGAAFARGQREHGIIATAKHFPGHGDTALDSHGVLPRIYASMDLLWDRELIPYRFLIREGIPAIMSAHLAFPNTPAGGTPASLSSWFLSDTLRDRMGFDGVIITDDLMMVGATIYTNSLSRAARQALASGNDIVMFSSTPHLFDPVWTHLLASMREDPVFRERVRDACRRVLLLKLQHLRGENKVPYMPDLATVQAGIVDPEGSAFFLDLAARSVTLVVNGDDVFPLSPQTAGRVLLAGNFTEFHNVGQRAFPSSVSSRYSFSQGAQELAPLVRSADTVIFLVSNRAGLRVLQELRRMVNMDAKNIIVFSVLSPAYLDELSWVDGAVAVYSSASQSFIAGFSAMLGRIPKKGTLPFTMNGN